MPTQTLSQPTDADESRIAAVRAAANAIQPIAALLLDLGISHNEFARLIKQAYVSEAQSRQRAHGSRPTISRIAAATGMSRQEVSQVLSTSNAPIDDPSLSLRPADRVLAAWTSDPDFLFQNGSPKPLRYLESSPSFTDLVKKHGPDIPPRALLKEFLASGLIMEMESDLFSPTRQNRASRQPRSTAIRDFGAKLNNFGMTLLRNLRTSDPQHLFESMTLTDSLPKSLSAKVSRELERRCRTFSQAIERFLLDQSESASTSTATDSRLELGVMVAVIEKPRSAQIETRGGRPTVA